MTSMRRALAVAVAVALVAVVGCGSADSIDATDEGTATTTTPEAAQLAEDWYAADEAYKNKDPDGVPVSDYYVPDGYHMYNTRKIDRDALAHHFAGTPGIWVEGKEPAVTATEPPCEHTLVGVMENTIASSVKATGELTFCIVTTDDGLRLHHTAWVVRDLESTDGSS